MASAVDARKYPAVIAGAAAGSAALTARLMSGPKNKRNEVWPIHAQRLREAEALLCEEEA